MRSSCAAQLILAVHEPLLHFRAGDRLALARLAHVRVELLGQVGEARCLGLLRKFALGLQRPRVAAVVDQVARLLDGAAHEEHRQNDRHQHEHHDPDGHSRREDAEAQRFGVREFGPIEGRDAHGDECRKHDKYESSTHFDDAVDPHSSSGLVCAGSTTSAISEREALTGLGFSVESSTSVPAALATVFCVSFVPARTNFGTPHSIRILR